MDPNVLSNAIFRHWKLLHYGSPGYGHMAIPMVHLRRHPCEPKMHRVRGWEHVSLNVWKFHISRGARGTLLTLISLTFFIHLWQGKIHIIRPTALTKQVVTTSESWECTWKIHACKAFQMKLSNLYHIVHSPGWELACTFFWQRFWVYPCQCLYHMKNKSMFCPGGQTRG